MTDYFDPIASALAPPEPEPGEDWQVLELRERARLDPLTGCPMTVGDLKVEPGEWDIMGLADRWSGLPPTCPVVPLGRTKGTSHLLDAMGDLAELKDSSSGKGPIGGLFAGRSRFLEWAWPRRGKGTKAMPKGPVVGWEADNARQALMDACAYEGAYDPDRMHGRGAWLDDAGKLAYHAGNRVFIGGRWQAPGRHGGWVYPTRPAMAAPWPTVVEGGSHGPFDEMLEVFQTWTWRRKVIDPYLLAGWVCMAMMSGALSWRAMVFITAEKGSGKSTLLEVLRILFGRGMLKTGNTTGAYLYQRLGHDCVPVIIDELEAQPDNGSQSAQKVIELIRMASSGDKIGRGSSDGIAKEFECRSAFVCTSINIPAMRGQDQSRFAFLNLDRFAEAKANPAIPWERMGEVGRQLLRRMIDGFPRWAETLLMFKQALIDIGGHDARGAEQFGALMAAAHIASSDEAPSAQDLARWATLLRAPDLSETAYKTDDWRECLNQLCDVTPEGLRNKSSSIPTLGHRLNAFARTHEALSDLQDICRMMGLTLSFPKGVLPTWENARLFIPSNHPETRKSFAGTSWVGIAGATGVWHTTLKRAPADIAWEGVCGAGLDKKRPGMFVALAKAFPDAGKSDAEYEEAA